LAAVLALSQARDWSGVRDALRQYVAPPIAFSYADADGHIGLQVAGRIPVRASGDGSSPGEGWTGASDWTGFVPFDEMPRMHDPAAGFVVAANAEITPAESGCFLGRAIVEPYRQRRIAELLAARPLLSCGTISSSRATRSPCTRGPCCRTS
ncbi:MAG: penicillin acylase family protein, partial [Vicinamibacterales bacterium]